MKLKKTHLAILSGVVMVFSSTLAVNAERKPATTLPETMDWIKEKINSYGSFTGSCDNNVKLTGNMKVVSNDGCTLVVEETIAKQMGGFTQVKTKTFNLQNIIPGSLDVGNNIMAGCWYSKETNPFFLTLSSNKKDIEVHLKDYAKDTQQRYATNSETIFFNSEDIANRSVKAIKYAIKLCNKEPF